MKVKITKKNGELNKFKVEMELTEGAILAVQHALERYESAIAKDVLGFWKRAGEQAGIVMV